MYIPLPLDRAVGVHQVTALALFNLDQSVEQRI